MSSCSGDGIKSLRKSESHQSVLSHIPILDMDKEQFIPLRDHIFLIEASAEKRPRGGKSEVGVKVETSVVLSPARVIKHGEPYSSLSTAPIDSVSNQSLDGKGFTLTFCPLQNCGDGLKGPDDNLPPQFGQVAKSLKFEQKNETTERLSGQIEQKSKYQTNKKSGPNLVVPSKYLQPRKGPMKVTNRNMDLLKNVASTSLGIKSSTLRHQNSIKNTSRFPGTKHSSNVMSSSLTRAHSFTPLDATVEPKTECELKKPSHLFFGEEADVTLSNMRVPGDAKGLRIERKQSGKPAYFSGNSVTLRKDEQREDKQVQERSTRQQCTTTTPTTGRKNNHTIDHKKGRTSTPNNTATQNISHYITSFGDVDMSSIELASALIDTTKDQQPLQENLYKDDCKKTLVKPRLSEEQIVGILYSRYLQYTYLDAKAEKSVMESELQALAEITKIRDLAINIRREKEILQKTCAQRLLQRMLEELMKIIDASLPDLLPKFESALARYENIADALETTRNSIETTGIYLPHNSNESGCITHYEGECAKELQESEALLNEILETVKDKSSAVQDISSSMAEMLEISEEGIKQMEMCINLLHDVVKLELDESTWRYSLTEDDDQLKSKYF